MKRPLVLIMLTALVLPLGTTFWLGWQNLERDRENLERGARSGLELRVNALDSLITKGLKDLESRLETLSRQPRLLLKGNPFIHQVFYLEDSRITTPGLEERSLQESEDCRRLEELLHQGPLWGALAEGSGGVPSKGWAVSPGMARRFYFWKLQSREAGAPLVVLEVNRGAFLSSLLDVLPDSPESEESRGHGLVLLDEQQKPFWKWGSWEPDPRSEALYTKNLLFPLAQWTWSYHLDPKLMPVLGRPAWELFAFPGVVLTLVLGLLFWYLRREIGRDLRDASQKVSFVNQVSHELKTPLTNIQLYADLALGQLGDSDRGLKNHLEIILAESRRLGRMIHNVLTFSKKQTLEKPALRSFELAPLVETIAQSFLPAFRAKGLNLELEGSPDIFVRGDPDWAGQILYNLVSNGEKYGAAGKKIKVKWDINQENVTVAVSDRGPGIPWGEGERIFQPFVRLSDKITEGVSGAGLGLSISRDLARSMGGDLVLQPSETGAVFLLTLGRGNPEELK